MKLISRLLTTTALCLSAGICMAGLPSQIYFTNDTDLELDATVAGRPGKSIDAHVSHYGVPYMTVYVACQYAGKQDACPIEFTDRNSGAKVAQVTIDASQAKVTSAPTLFGDYNAKYKVSGWEQNPLDHITISNR